MGKLKFFENEENFWDSKVVPKIRRILHLRTIEAMSLFEQLFSQGKKKCFSFIQNNLEPEISIFCKDLLKEILLEEDDDYFFLQKYKRRWHGFKIALKDLCKVFSPWIEITAIEKIGLDCWISDIYALIGIKLHYALNRLLKNNNCNQNINNINTNNNEFFKFVDFEFFQKKKPYENLFSFHEKLLIAIKGEEIFSNDEFEDFGPIKNLIFFQEDISIEKEFSENGMITTSLLPSELVYLIFLFLENEHDLLTAAQVCRRWYKIGRDRVLRNTFFWRRRKNHDFIKMKSNEGHEFILGFQEAVQSETIFDIFNMHTSVEAMHNELRFSLLSTNILEKIVEYFYYKSRFSNGFSGPIPQFQIDNTDAFRLLSASKFLRI